MSIEIETFRKLRDQFIAAQTSGKDFPDSPGLFASGEEKAVYARALRAAAEAIVEAKFGKDAKSAYDQYYGSVNTTNGVIAGNHPLDRGDGVRVDFRFPLDQAGVDRVVLGVGYRDNVVDVMDNLRNGGQTHYWRPMDIAHLRAEAADLAGSQPDHLMDRTITFLPAPQADGRGALPGIEATTGDGVSATDGAKFAAEGMAPRVVGGRGGILPPIGGVPIKDQNALTVAEGEILPKFNKDEAGRARKIIDDAVAASRAAELKALTDKRDADATAKNWDGVKVDQGRLDALNNNPSGNLFANNAALEALYQDLGRKAAATGDHAYITALGTLRRAEGITAVQGQNQEYVKPIYDVPLYVTRQAVLAAHVEQKPGPTQQAPGGPPKPGQPKPGQAQPGSTQPSPAEAGVAALATKFSAAGQAVWKLYNDTLATPPQGPGDKLAAASDQLFFGVPAHDGKPEIKPAPTDKLPKTVNDLVKGNKELSDLLAAGLKTDPHFGDKLQAYIGASQVARNDKDALRAGLDGLKVPAAKADAAIAAIQKAVDDSNGASCLNPAQTAAVIHTAVAGSTPQPQPPQPATTVPKPATPGKPAPRGRSHDEVWFDPAHADDFASRVQAIQEYFELHQQTTGNRNQKYADGLTVDGKIDPAKFDPTKLDGIFGIKTQADVLAFQTQWNKDHTKPEEQLPLDGKLDDKTFGAIKAKLDADIAAAAALAAKAGTVTTTGAANVQANLPTRGQRTDQIAP